jgi:hypothetical protein
MFPTNIHSTGMSVSYNIGVTVFGGFAPLILTWLIASIGSLLAPSYYYVLVAVVSLIGLTVARTRLGHRWEEELRMCLVTSSVSLGIDAQRNSQVVLLGLVMAVDGEPGRAPV